MPLLASQPALRRPFIARQGRISGGKPRLQLRPGTYPRLHLHGRYWSLNGETQARLAGRLPAVKLIQRGDSPRTRKEPDLFVIPMRRPIAFLFAGLLLALCAGFAGDKAQAAETDTQKAHFRVVRVDSNDVLNMRIVPDPYAAKVGAIPPDARGIEATGRTAKRGDYIWREIMYRDVTGWVNSHFLVRDRAQSAGAPPQIDPEAEITGSTSGTSVFLEPLSCAGTEPFWGMLLKGRETVLDSLADGPLQIDLSPARQSPQMSTAWAIDARTKAENKPVSIIIRRTNQCSDGMSDIIFPYETFITISGGPFYAGCCNTASGSGKN